MRFNAPEGDGMVPDPHYLDVARKGLDSRGHGWRMTRSPPALPGRRRFAMQNNGVAFHKRVVAHSPALFSRIDLILEVTR